jgi:hypothetical protein
MDEKERVLEEVKALFAQTEIIEQAASVSLHRAVHEYLVLNFVQ